MKRPNGFGNVGKYVCGLSLFVVGSKDALTAQGIITVTR